jgi:hypothetical protein
MAPISPAAELEPEPEPACEPAGDPGAECSESEAVTALAAMSSEGEMEESELSSCGKCPPSSVISD